MKKIIVSISFITLLLFSSTIFVFANTHQITNENKEKLYPEIILNFLEPHIEKEVEKYYLEYFIYPPTVYPYHNKVLYVERIEGTIFRVKVRVESFFGPHISVGTDDITFRVSSSCVEVEKIEHIKSYKLPERYEGYIREGFDNPPIMQK